MSDTIECSDGMGRFTVTMPRKAMLAMSRAGDVTEDVEYWASKIARPLEATPEAVREVCRETGAWGGEELADDAENWRRVLWMLAGDAREEERSAGR